MIRRWFLDFKTMRWCIFEYLGKIIVIILRCWLLQLTTILITKLQHPSHKKQTTLETIRFSYASFLLLFAYRWPLLVHWRVQRWARAHVNKFGPEKGSWTFITSLYVHTMNSTIQFCILFLFFQTEIKFWIRIMFPLIQFLKRCLY